MDIELLTTPCACGCGAIVTHKKLFPSQLALQGPRRFLVGHMNIGRKLTPEHKAAAARKLEQNGRWKGGRTLDADGYVLIKDTSHPFRTKANYVREHRLLIERQLGRTLKPGEVVHHLNGIKNDNRIENLVLLGSQIEHNQLERTGKRFPRSTTQTLICPTCGKTFYRSRSYGRSKFCSWECRYPRLYPVEGSHRNSRKNRSQV